MIDFHSHLLPGIDDGSDSVETSIAMLSMWQSQGIDNIIATPHFYADKSNLEDFLRKRQAAFDSLRKGVSLLPDGDKMPKLMLGAEVYFFPGIGKFEEIDKLCLQGTKILLLEMPFSQWTDRTIADVEELTTRGIVPVLAHLERYKDVAGKKLLDKLTNLDVYVQANASYFMNFWGRGKAIKELKSGYITFIGSDAHNTNTRMPDMGPALEYIESKLGSEFLMNLCELQEAIIVDNAIN